MIEDDGVRMTDLEDLVSNWEGRRDIALLEGIRYNNLLDNFTRDLDNPYNLVQTYYDPSKKEYFYSVEPIEGLEFQKAINKSFNFDEYEDD